MFNLISYLTLFIVLAWVVKECLPAGVVRIGKSTKEVVVPATPEVKESKVLPLFSIPEFGHGPLFVIDKPWLGAGISPLTSHHNASQWQDFKLKFYHVPVDMLKEFLADANPGFLHQKALPIITSHRVLVPIQDSESFKKSLDVSHDPDRFYPMTLNFSNPSQLLVEFPPPSYKVDPRVDKPKSGVLQSAIDKPNQAEQRLYYESDLEGLYHDAKYKIQPNSDFYLILMAEFKEATYHEHKDNFSYQHLYVPINHLNPLRYTLFAGQRP
jgi:hypothetical protein